MSLAELISDLHQHHPAIETTNQQEVRQVILPKVVRPVSRRLLSAGRCRHCKEMAPSIRIRNLKS